MNYDPKQFLQIPYDIIQQCMGNPLDAMIWSYVFGWENSSKMSKVKLKLDNIAEFFGVNEKTVYASLDRLQAKSLIGKVKTLHGTVISTRKDQIRRFDNSEKRSNKTPKNGVIEPSKTEQYYSEKRSNHISKSSSLDLSSTNTSSSTTYSSREASSSSGENSSPEPFEGTPQNGWSKSQLENLRHYGSVGRPRRPLCDFQPSDEANILQTFSKLDLGEIRAIFTQQQADTPEFVSECLSELSLARRKQGGVRNPIGLLVVIRDKKWADGLFLEREKIKAEEKDKWMDDMVAYAVSCLKRQG